MSWCHMSNASKQTKLLDGLAVGPPRGCVSGHGLKQPVHEVVHDIPNVKFHLKTRSGNVNIYKYHINSYNIFKE